MSIGQDGGPLGLASEIVDENIFSKLQALEREACLSAIGRMTRLGYERTLIEQLRVEFLRFIALQHLLDTPIAPAKLVDDFWHAFILETPAYIDFCNAHFGKYVHHYHDPKTPDTYQRTRELIFRMFPLASEKVWTDDSVPCSSGGVSSV